MRIVSLALISSKYIVTNTRLASLLAGLSTSVYVTAYVRLSDMATARKAKHINCRLTPQKQHDLISLRMYMQGTCDPHARFEISFRDN